MDLKENEMLTRVGPGTPAGELLRCYWQPVGFVKELKGRPKRKKLLGEDLVLFSDDKGRLGLIGLYCSHRNTSLEWGHIEDGGLRCCYHGWLYDVNGRVMEQPCEPPGSTFKDRIKHPSYKVEVLGGVIFAYMGPEPAPLLPRYDVLVREDGVRAIAGRINNCNYFQMIENTLDPFHFKWLHRTPFTRQWDNEEIDFQVTDYGFMNIYTRRVDGQKRYAHISHFIFPNINRIGGVPRDPHIRHGAGDPHHIIGWRTPMDDTHTMRSFVHFYPFVDGKPADNIMEDKAEEGFQDTVPGVYEWDDETGWIAQRDQDRCGQESQGPISDRTTEHLGASDKGVIMLRNRYLEAIEALKRGIDPPAIIREPEKNRIIELIPREELVS